MSNHIEIREVTITYVDPFPGKDDAEVTFVNCDRCGGAGHIAGFEPIYGGVCFGCNGHRGANSTVGAERKKAKGKVAYARTKERKLLAKQAFHNAQMEAAEAAHPILAGWFEAMSTDAFLTDLWSKAFDYELSEAQVNAAAAGMQRTADRKAQRQAEHDALSPAPEGKQRISGTVVHVQLREGNYGSVWKMIVLDHRNFKVWTTLPRGLWDLLDAERTDENYNTSAEDFVGREVAFNATIEPSADDNTFAFASRPTKPALTAQHEAPAPEEAAAPAAPEEAAQAPAETAAAEAPAAETLTHKDGTVYTFISTSKDGLCYRVKDSAGKASYKRITAFL